MDLKEESAKATKDSDGPASSTSGCSEKLYTSRISDCSADKKAGSSICRVCHCAESDIRGDVALSFLNIVPPLKENQEINGDRCSNGKRKEEHTDNDPCDDMGKDNTYIKFITPEGQVFVCATDLESGTHVEQDILIDLGCSCKNDLSLAHYACALKWFIIHGSTICEICGKVAKNVRVSDIGKVITSLKDYEELRLRIIDGELAVVNYDSYAGADTDLISSICLQRLTGVLLWFNTHNNSVQAPDQILEESSNNTVENVIARENPGKKCFVEALVILVACGLLTLILIWLIAPRLGKKNARDGLHIILGGICASAVVIFLRFRYSQ